MQNKLYEDESQVIPPGSNYMKPPFNEKRFGLGRELEERGEEKRILMNLHVKRMIDDHFKPSLKKKGIKCPSYPCKG